MDRYSILYPSFALAFLTFAIGVWMRKTRVRARREGLDPEYFRLNRGAEPPDYLVRVSQHYDNLFEMPVLFYVISIIAYVTLDTDGPVAWLGWLYVLIRYAHAYIHTTYNDLAHRRLVFFLGSLVLFVMWTRVLVLMIAQ